MNRFGRGRRSTEKRLSFLRSNLRAGETEAAQTRGWERVPAAGDAEILMLVTDQRLVWTYVKDPTDLVLDLSFKDVVACLGAEGERGLILEAGESRYSDIGQGQTTLAHFRFMDDASAVEVIRLVERSIPPAARDLNPDIHGTGHRESLSETPEGRLFESFMKVRNALAEGVDPTLEVDGYTPTGEPVRTEAYFRAGLRIMYEDQDEVAAFDLFAGGLREEARRIGVDAEALARLEVDIQMVREYLTKRIRSDELPPPPP